MPKKALFSFSPLAEHMELMRQMRPPQPFVPPSRAFLDQVKPPQPFVPAYRDMIRQVTSQSASDDARNGGVVEKIQL
ncbi:hypothetical protein D187_007348 [Cystobacter fuscus DSM 2262]|uniref:Uncharacterized protein n=1 Tax=Cystobacter fuscus (strain ATCC 25194 / DSM 2262 / NBRC 100088 / M29) TaxID=1242864 RepID=S9NYP7_CYSF2|nr:hypothetical protein [Cystobacter fuscus]EPX56006.1 hypothetical protein D187_007348 [Cystobacter fuscus DSM 2262]